MSVFKFAMLALACYAGVGALTLLAVSWSAMPAIDAAMFGFHMALCAVAFVMAQVSAKDLK